ncbi:MAG: hypothetical protein ABIR50_11005 [Ginsengibacter sp.]
MNKLKPFSFIIFRWWSAIVKRTTKKVLRNIAAMFFITCSGVCSSFAQPYIDLINVR